MFFKSYIYILLLIFTALALGQSSRKLTSSAIEYQQDLIAYYPFHSNGDDALGNASAAFSIVTGCPNRHGEVGKAFQFGAADGTVVFPNEMLDKINGKKELSIFMWMKKQNDLTSQNVILHGTKTGGNDFWFELINYRFKDAYSKATTKLTDIIQLNKWHHIGFTFNEKIFEVFIDGKLILFDDAKPTTYTIDLAYGGFLFGQDQDSIGGGFEAAQAFQGQISDVRVYSTAVGNQMVRDIYISEKDLCSFTCQNCNGDNTLCTSCRGDRILVDGKCFCPFGKQEDFISTNCISADLETNLLVYYPLQQNTTDIVNDLQGTDVGCPYAENRHGKSKLARSFSDTTTRVNTPVQSIITGKNTMSISIWAVLTDITNNRWLLNAVKSNGVNTFSLSKTHLVFNDDKVVDCLEFNVDIVENEWFQVVLTFDANLVYIYKDGVLIGYHTKFDYSFNTIATNGFVIGQDQDSVDGTYDASQSWVGSMSDFRIYQNQLTAEQIWDNYYSEKYPCKWACETCFYKSTQCASCRGNRIPHNGECLCPQEQQEDHKSENCPEIIPKIETDLLSYFPFHNNGTDVHNGNNGISNNLSPVPNRLNQPDTAFQFEDATTYFDIPSTVINGLNTYSLSGWFKITDPNYFPVQVNRIMFSAAKADKDVVLEGQNGMQLDNNFMLGPTQQYFCNGVDYIDTYSTSKIYKQQTMNEWNQYIFVIEENNFKIYIDDKLYLQQPKQDYALTVADGGFIIGQDQDTVGGGFQDVQSWVGPVSDIRVYQTALSGDQVKDLLHYEKYFCEFPCSHCVWESTDCAFCRGDRILTSGKCPCPAKKYEDNFSTNCPDCEYQCKTCQKTANECLTCEDSANRIATPNCLCKTGFFDQENGQSECLQCNHKCTDCETNALNCTSCKGTNRLDVLNDCICESGYYDNGVLSDCQQCDSSCKTCASGATNCLTCKNDTREGSQCLCKGGLWENAGADICEQCDNNCKSCEISSDNCTQCIDPTLMTKFPQCECISGYYFDIIGLVCKQCSNKCKTCSGAADTCDTCSDSTRLGADCECKSGFYETGLQKCTSNCDLKCTQCETHFQNCTQCAYNRTGLPDCGTCLEGYYEIQGTPFCVQCNPQCALCSQKADVCDSCKDPEMLLPLCLTSKLGNVVIVGTDGNSLDVKCDTKCKLCETTQHNCTQCKGINREDISKNCECIYGHHDNNGRLIDCNQCLENCESCSSFNVCTKCLGNRDLDQSGKCVCKPGFEGQSCLEKCDKMYFRDIQDNCQKCQFYQGICLAKCPTDTELIDSFQCDKKEISSVLIMVIIGCSIFLVAMPLILLYVTQVNKHSLKSRQKALQQI